MDNKKNKRERKLHLKNLKQIKIDDCQTWADMYSKEDYEKIKETFKTAGASAGAAWQFGSEAKSDPMEDKPKIIQIDWNCVRQKLISSGRVIITLLDENTLKQMLKEFFVKVDSENRNFFEIGEFIFLIIDPYSETVRIRKASDLLDYKDIVATIRQERMLDEKSTKSKYDKMLKSIFFVRPEVYENKTSEAIFEQNYQNQLSKILAADQSWKNIDWNEGETKNNIDPKLNPWPLYFYKSVHLSFHMIKRQLYSLSTDHPIKLWKPDVMIDVFVDERNVGKEIGSQELYSKHVCYEQKC